MLKTFITLYWIENGTFDGIDKAPFAAQLSAQAELNGCTTIQEYCLSVLPCKSKKLQKDIGILKNSKEKEAVMLLMHAILSTDNIIEFNDLRINLNTMIWMYVAEDKSLDKLLTKSITLDDVLSCVKTALQDYKVCSADNNFMRGNRLYVSEEVTPNEVLSKACECIMRIITRLTGHVVSPVDLVLKLFAKNATPIYILAKELNITLSELLALFDLSIPDLSNCYSQCGQVFIIVDESCGILFDEKEKPFLTSTEEIFGVAHMSYFNKTAVQLAKGF